MNAPRNTPGAVPAKAAEVELEREIPFDASTLASLAKAEIDMAIATAHRFPRAITAFREEAEQLVTLTDDVAAECIYQLERKDSDGKIVTIEGPSSRFAEVLAHAWGNCRVGARVVDDSGDFVVAQGAFHDLQKNVAIQYEVRRRITGRGGRRYSADMIGVTANAACSIALRNAVLKGIPKALWSSVYAAARRTMVGDYTSLTDRRKAAFDAFRHFGVRPEQIFARLGVRGEDDMTIEHVFSLRGLLTALREGDTTVEDAFPQPSSAQTEKGAGAAIRTAMAAKRGGEQTAGDAAPAPSGGEPPAASATAGAPEKPTHDEAGKKVRVEAGTPEMKARTLGMIGKATDAEVMAIGFDEVRMYEWSEADLEELTNAYNARLAALAGAAGAK